jgi:hypothetical protein
MYVKGGIAVDSWVKLDHGCDISYDVVGDELQITFGSSSGPSLDLIITDEIIDRIAEILTEARTKFQDPVPEAGAESGT